MAKKNTGISFEKNVQEIYQAFMNYDTQEKSFQKIQVEHNVVLQGKSGCKHQIDVYWKFYLAGNVYETLVEVKDWKTPVKQEQLESFKAVLDDIRGFPTGVFVSKGGFQEGAKRYASAHGIKLVQISEKNNNRYLTVHVTDYTTHYELLEFTSDDERFENNKIGQAVLNDMVNTNASYENEILINPAGDSVMLADLMHIDAIPYYYSPANEVFHIERQLHGSWFWVCNQQNLPMLKITAYKFKCYNTVCTSIIELQHKQLPCFVIKDILDNVEHRYNSHTKEFCSC